MHLDCHAPGIGARRQQRTGAEGQIETAGETTALQKPFAAESHVSAVGRRGMAGEHRARTSRPVPRAESIGFGHGRRLFVLIVGITHHHVVLVGEVGGEMLQPFVTRRTAVGLHHDHPRRTGGTDAEGHGHLVGIDVAPTTLGDEGVAQMAVLRLKTRHDVDHCSVFAGGIGHHHLIRTETLRQKQREVPTEGFGFVLHRQNDGHQWI